MKRLLTLFLALGVLSSTTLVAACGQPQPVRYEQEEDDDDD